MNENAKADIAIKNNNFFCLKFEVNKEEMYYNLSRPIFFMENKLKSKLRLFKNISIIKPLAQFISYDYFFLTKNNK